MKQFIALFIFFSFLSQNIIAQTDAKKWVDKTFKKLSKDQRIAQLMVVRTSTYNADTKVVTFFDDQVKSLIKKYNIGGICLFQGGPVRQAQMLNQFQAMAKTPIMVCIDAEWGLGMRILDTVASLPRQMMLGAMQNPNVVYQYGKAVAEQCKRMGIHVNYAPVIDVNNNPANPVINDRSFGEDKMKVAQFGTEYIRGMQDLGVMGCVKHFPGHGDVNVDSHYDLPIIYKSRAALDSLELYPFREVFKNSNVGSVMIAHLAIPAIDSTKNKPTSISKNNVTGILRNELGYKGISFTDALEMQGVKKFYPDGEASVQSIIAGNDMLCLPGDIPTTIAAIKKAIKDKRITWDEINEHCKKVLYSKYEYVLNNIAPINTDNLAIDLNKDIAKIKKLVAENAITLVNNSNPDFLKLNTNNIVQFVSIGNGEQNELSTKMRNEIKATTYVIKYSATTNDFDKLLATLITSKTKVVISLNNMGRRSANNFGLSETSLQFIKKMHEALGNNLQLIVFGNAYALKNFTELKNILVCYEDDPIIQSTCFEILQGIKKPLGKLPVTVTARFPFGTGIASSVFFCPLQQPNKLGLAQLHLTK